MTINIELLHQAVPTKTTPWDKKPYRSQSSTLGPTVPSVFLSWQQMALKDKPSALLSTRVRLSCHFKFYLSDCHCWHVLIFCSLITSTEPETVKPTISGHSNSSITVTWTKPKGNVAHYSLQLIRNTTIQSLNSLNTSYQFENLSAGRAYSVMLTTISGPFNASSELVTNATRE